MASEIDVRFMDRRQPLGCALSASFASGGPKDITGMNGGLAENGTITYDAANKAMVVGPTRYTDYVKTLSSNPLAGWYDGVKKSDFTICYWIRTDATTDQHAIIKHDGTFTYFQFYSGFRYQNTYYKNNCWLRYGTNGSGNTYPHLRDNNGQSGDGGWGFNAYTWVASTGVITNYNQAVKYTSVAAGILTSVTVQGPLAFGWGMGPNNGKLANIMFFHNKILTDSEIMQIYLRGRF